MYYFDLSEFLFYINLYVIKLFYNIIYVYLVHTLLWY